MIEQFTIPRSLLEKIIGYLQTQPWGQVNGMMIEIQVVVNEAEQRRRRSKNDNN